ncbi:MAG: 50S ribosomal protein L29 [Lautropia sp.]|nr:50S ribosomal protein L29 [Lautropia sp.]
MKAKDLRTKDAAGLDKELQELQRAHFALRMQIATQQNSNTAQLKRLRRDIARVRTVINEQQVAAK